MKVKGFTTKKYERVEVEKLNLESCLSSIDHEIKKLLAKKGRIESRIKMCQSSLDFLEPRLKCDENTYTGNMTNTRSSTPSICCFDVLTWNPLDNPWEIWYNIGVLRNKEN